MVFQIASQMCLASGLVVIALADWSAASSVMLPLIHHQDWKDYPPFLSLHSSLSKILFSTSPPQVGL